MDFRFFVLSISFLYGLLLGLLSPPPFFHSFIHSLTLSFLFFPLPPFSYSFPLLFSLSPSSFLLFSPTPPSFPFLFPSSNSLLHLLLLIPNSLPLASSLLPPICSHVSSSSPHNLHTLFFSSSQYLLSFISFSNLNLAILLHLFSPHPFFK